MKNIGEKIKELRERERISQQRLAELIGMPRPSISQIERGGRKISAEELRKLSEIFNTSADYLLDLRDAPEVILHQGSTKSPSKPEIRINVPKKNLEKFKQVLLYILCKVGAKPNIGETVIYKLLYFIDFDYYEKYEEQLIGATYIKNTYGPTPIEFQKIVSEMVENEEITILKDKYFDYPQTKYIPLKEGDTTKINAREIQTIDEVLNHLSDMSATQISNYSHGDVPWLSAASGEKIEYETVFYRTPAYSKRG